MSYSTPLLLWLKACLTLVVLMVAIGGATRLTESGLSIVRWEPVSGTLPPLSEAAWREQFDAYRASPQYREVNAGMDLAGFKRIFFLEYVHRLLGRITGMVFILPLLWFAARRRIPRWLGWRMAGLSLLVGAQGAAGWYMVASGLVDDPRVSPYRLALHLLLAMLLFGGLVLTVLRIGIERGRIIGNWNHERHTHSNLQTPASNHLFSLSLLTTFLLVLQMVLGALVAGLDAGLTYNSFPLMDGQWIPEGMGVLHPAWRNFFENIITVQFMHRVTAFIVAGAIVALCLSLWRTRHFRPLAMALVCAVTVQTLLGIATLLLVVPLGLAMLHQLGAIGLLGLCLIANYVLLRRESEGEHHGIAGEQGGIRQTAR